MKTLSILVAAATLTLAGCGSTSNEVETAKADTKTEVTKVAKKKKNVKCRTEKPTGSRLGSYKCTTQKQREARSSTARAILENHAHNTSGRVVVNGG